MAKEPILTIEHLRQLLDYDPQSGILTFLPRTAETFADPARVAGWNTRFAGKEAGLVSPTTGYKQFTTGTGVRWLAHRVAFALYFGRWPEMVDHIDGDRANNKLANLREVSPQENQRNKGKGKNNKSGVTGLYWEPARGKWCVSIGVNGKKKHLGRFATFEEALQSRREAEQKYGFSPRHGR